jgi:pimeloyl-ACP methyl ester carboxylesterase
VTIALGKIQQMPMIDRKYNYLNCPNPPHKMAYTEWGDFNNNKVLICVHGLTRTGRDFDVLASALSSAYRVICLDIVGRGESDWLARAENYIYATYIADIFTLLEQLKIGKIDWLGTSMGGLIGMFIAAQPNSPIQRLILNDVGAFIPKEALVRIAKYILFGQRKFANFSEVQAHIKENYSGFGKLTESQWQELAKHSVKLAPDGGYILHYDPQISYLLRGFPDLEDIDLWEVWQKINCPTLLIHGEESDLLLPSTITQMQSLKPDLEVIQIAETGHAPSLMTPQQIRIVHEWLMVTGN